MIKKLSLRGVLIFGFAALSGGLLFYTSQTVQRTEAELRTTQRNILKEQESIRVLQAEWAFLNSPARLEGLAAEYLELRPPGVAQIMPKNSSLPDAVPADPVTGKLQDVSFSLPVPAVEEPPASEIFVTPHKKPVRKSPIVKKRFDALLDELGQGGGTQ